MILQLTAYLNKLRVNEEYPEKIHSMPVTGEKGVMSKGNKLHVDIECPD